MVLKSTFRGFAPMIRVKGFALKGDRLFSEAKKDGKKSSAQAAEAYKAVEFSKNLCPRFLKRPLPLPIKYGR